MDYLTLGPTPYGEDCQQLGPNYNPALANLEMKVYLAQLRREFPQAILKIKHFPHDFGTYGEVVAIFDEDNYESEEAAFDAENNLPEFWDEISKEALSKGFAEIAGVKQCN